jgi:hypothetical protein
LGTVLEGIGVKREEGSDIFGFMKCDLRGTVSVTAHWAQHQNERREVEIKND